MLCCCLLLLVLKRTGCSCPKCPAVWWGCPSALVRLDAAAEAAGVLLLFRASVMESSSRVNGYALKRCCSTSSFSSGTAVSNRSSSTLTTPRLTAAWYNQLSTLLLDSQPPRSTFKMAVTNDSGGAASPVYPSRPLIVNPPATVTSTGRHNLPPSPQMLLLLLIPPLWQVCLATDPPDLTGIARRHAQTQQLMMLRIHCWS